MLYDFLFRGVLHLVYESADSNIIYSTGCIGHGVLLNQLNGRLIADLVLEKDTILTQFWIVNRSAIPMPPGNMLRFAGAKLIEGVLKAVDFYEEGNLKYRHEGSAT